MGLDKKSLEVFGGRFRVFSPINSEPPVLAGGDQLRVTLLLVTFATRTFSGHEGGAKENLNYNNAYFSACYVHRNYRKRKVEHGV